MSRPMKDSGIEWIGEIPEDWGQFKLKYIVDNVTVKNKNDFNYIGLENIVSQTGEYIEVSEKTTLGGDTLSYENDNILFGKLRPYLAKVFRTTVAGCCSSEFLVLKIKTGDVDYLKYRLLSPDFIEAVNSSTYGTKMPRASWSFIGNLVVAIPSIIEQQKITSYLNQQLTLIDNILSKTRESIEEYKKYKQSLITEAVTKGLDLNVKMKDSGVEWIGEIPEHWEFVKIKTLLHEINERNDNENAVLLSLFTALGVAPRSKMEDKGNKAMTVIGYKNVKSGDLIVNKLLAWMGAIAFSAYEGVTSPDYDVYRFNKNANAIEEFYEWYFRFTNFKDDCYKYGRGIMMMRWRTYPSEFKMIQVVNPPLDEQKLIVEYLKNKVVEIDLLISKKIELLSQLESYKKSLIYEVVTGKKEV